MKELKVIGYVLIDGEEVPIDSAMLDAEHRRWMEIGKRACEADIDADVVDACNSIELDEAFKDDPENVILLVLKNFGTHCYAAGLNAQNETYCAYCGERFPLDAPSSAQLVGEHIMTCPKHPIADLKAENACLKAVLVNIVCKPQTLDGRIGAPNYHAALILLSEIVEEGRAALARTKQKG